MEPSLGSGVNVERDKGHLRLLSIFHYIVGALGLLVGCVFLIYVVIGGALLTRPEFFNNPGHGSPPPPAVGWAFIGLGAAVFLFAVVYAVAMIIAARSLVRCRRYVFCLVMAALSMMCQPWGTVLGIFTFVVLLRPSVKALFGQQAP